MTILVTGMPKSGTTALLQAVSRGLPGARVETGRRPVPNPGRGAGGIVWKATFSAAKGRGVREFEQCSTGVGWDRRIWILRDPRDVAISTLLFFWNRGASEEPERFARQLAMIQAKEKDPASCSMLEIWRHGFSREAAEVTVETVVAQERERYDAATGFIKAHRDAWFFFAYDDLVEGRFDALSRYLGFEVAAVDADASHRTAKVMRRGGSGDWRHWFTPFDVKRLEGVYAPFLKAAQLDAEDWRLEAQPVLDPAYGSAHLLALRDRERLRGETSG